MADSVTKADLDEFRSFLLKELNDHKDQLVDQVTGSCNKAESALALSKQLKTDADIKFTHSGNERHFKVNTELREILATALELLESTELDQFKDTLDKALALIDERNRKIRIADTSEAGWLTVKRYEASAVALDPEDDKKIRQAEREVLREKANASKPRRQYGLPFKAETRRRGSPTFAFGRSYDRCSSSGFPTWNPTPNTRSSRGSCRFCGAYGHWWRECLARNNNGNTYFTPRTIGLVQHQHIQIGIFFYSV